MPRVSLTDTEMAAALAPAGLQFIDRVRGEVRLPLKPNKSAASSLPEDGRFDARPEEVVDVDDPDLAGKLNAGWLRMATEYGLLTASGSSCSAWTTARSPMTETGHGCASGCWTNGTSSIARSSSSAAGSPGCSPPGMSLSSSSSPSTGGRT